VDTADIVLYVSVPIAAIAALAGAWVFVRRRRSGG
jgi:hypothetical protein